MDSVMLQKPGLHNEPDEQIVLISLITVSIRMQ